MMRVRNEVDTESVKKRDENVFKAKKNPLELKMGKIRLVGPLKPP